MPQIFRPNSNRFLRWALALAPVLFLLTLALAEVIDRSSYVTRQQQIVDQQVPFSHQHHVGEVGIDCRYCHAYVERGPNAGLPSPEMCITCHSQIWNTSSILETVRNSLSTTSATSMPITWQKVTSLPDYVYFNHSIHIAKGVSCVSCHGQIENMPLTYLAHPMEMEFCLGCHRDPQNHLQAPDDVFRAGPETISPVSEQLMKNYRIERKVDCTTCHR